MMRTAVHNALLAAALAAIFHLPAAAQQAAPNQAIAAYDSSAEARISGTVAAVMQPNSTSGLPGIHLILNAGGEKLDVHVGPAAFLRANNLEFAPGDSVQVLGATATLASGKVFLAREVRKGDQVLQVRNARGIPLWLAGGRAALRSPAAQTGRAR